MTERSLSCAGGCGRSMRFSDDAGSETVEVHCATCHMRIFGQPSQGFVGFVDGWLRTVRRVTT